MGETAIAIVRAAKLIDIDGKSKMNISAAPTTTSFFTSRQPIM